MIGRSSSWVNGAGGIPGRRDGQGWTRRYCPITGTTALRTTDSGRRVVLWEGTWAIKLDEFCEYVGVWPNALKIDVAGARAALSRAGLPSLIVEAGEAELDDDARVLLTKAGLHR